MFEITDEFLNQAGFGSLVGEQRERLRENVTREVESRIGDRVTSELSEQQAMEIEKLMDTDDVDFVRQVAERIKPDYTSSDDFVAVKKIATEQGASEDDALRSYVIFNWYSAQGIDIAGVVQASMNEAMQHLQQAFNDAYRAVE